MDQEVNPTHEINGINEIREINEIHEIITVDHHPNTIAMTDPDTTDDTIVTLMTDAVAVTVEAEVGDHPPPADAYPPTALEYTLTHMKRNEHGWRKDADVVMNAKRYLIKCPLKNSLL